MLAGGEAQLAFGLGDLEAGDAEAEGFQDVDLDLVVGGLCLGSREIGVLQIEGHADGHVRIFSDQLNNRLDVPRSSRIRVRYALTVRGNKSRAYGRLRKHIYEP